MSTAFVPGHVNRFCTNSRKASHFPWTPVELFSAELFSLLFSFPFKKFIKINMS